MTVIQLTHKQPDSQEQKLSLFLSPPPSNCFFGPEVIRPLNNAKMFLWNHRTPTISSHTLLQREVYHDLTVTAMSGNNFLALRQPYRNALSPEFLLGPGVGGGRASYFLSVSSTLMSETGVIIFTINFKGS